MKNYKLQIGFILFILGLAGVFSLLTVPVPLESLPPEVTGQFSETALRWLTLINPAFLLILAVVFGTLLHDKVRLSVPTLNNLIRGEDAGSIFLRQLKVGLAGGAIAGLLMLGVEQVFKPMMPQEFFELGANLQLSPVTRFLYGGITEEILLRYGLMTILVWALYKISKSLSDVVYWIAILVASLLFALAHLPVVFQASENPSITLIAYILLGNSIGGIIFGWLYWKRGLEASFIAHLMVHVVILIAGLLV